MMSYWKRQAGCSVGSYVGTIGGRWKMLACSLVALAATAAIAQAGPSFRSATFITGSSNQSGVAIVARGTQLHVAGNSTDSAGVTHGVLAMYALPPSGTPIRKVVVADNQYFLGLAVTEFGIFPVGTATKPNSRCNPDDPIGSIEGKSAIARVSLSGSFLGCSSKIFFPYSGGEGYTSVAAATVGGLNLVWAGGAGESQGFGPRGGFVAMYNGSSGVEMANIVYELPSSVAARYTEVLGLHHLAPALYSVGHRGVDDNLGGDISGVTRPQIIKYDQNTMVVLARNRPADVVGVFRAATSLNGFIYAVGNTYTAENQPSGVGVKPVPGSARFLVAKYDQSLNRIWLRELSAGPADDVLTGVTALGGKIYAVGYANSITPGVTDAAILEIDPLTGNVLSRVKYSAAPRSHFANGVSTDGRSLYVVGESRTRATPGSPAKGDIMVLHYTLGNRAPIAKISGPRLVTIGSLSLLSASSSTDPDGDPLSFGWTMVSKPIGSVIELGVNLDTASLVPDLEGIYTVRLKASDGQGGVSWTQVNITAIIPTF